MRRARAALAALALLSGCTRVDAPATAGRHPWTHPGHLRIGTTEEPDGLNKLLANNDAADQLVNLLEEPLFRYDPDGNLVPGLASEVPSPANGGISRDGRTITLRLRRGLTWSDGAPLDGRDVVFTWRAAMNPRNNTRLRTGWDQIDSMTLRDPLTVVVRTKTVYGGLLGIFAIGGAGYPPLPAHLLAGLPDLNHAAFNAHPISSGPFVLERWNHGSSLELVANPRYFRGRPRLDRISVRIIPNSDTLLNAVETHDVDFYGSVGENQIPRLRGMSGVAAATKLSANWRHLEFNCRRPNLADVRVRRAIATAVDWDRINDVIYHGLNRRAVSDIFPLSWAAPHGIPPVRYDPAATRRLLDAAGWRMGPDGVRVKDGRPLDVSISTTPAKQANVQSELQMQQQLRDVGVRLEIKNYLPSLLFAHDGPLYGGRYDMSFSIDTNGPDPDNEGNWSANAIPPKGANTSFLADPIVTREAHLAIATFDKAERARHYQREEERLHELVPAVFLYWQNNVTAYNVDLKGYRPTSFIVDFAEPWALSI